MHIHPLVSATLLILIALTSAQSNADTTKTKIGVIVPLTGPLAEFGLAAKNGIKLAEKHYLNILGDVEFVFEDSSYKPQIAITAFRKLVSQDHVDLVLNFGCPTSQAISPLAEQSKIPAGLFCSSHLLTKGKEYSFGLTSPAPDWAQHLWRYFQSRQVKSICMLLTENDYLVSEFNALKMNMIADDREDDIDIIDRFAPDDVDFRTAITRLRSRKCDAIGLYFLPGQIRSFFSQLEGRKLSAPVFGTDIFESPEEIAAASGGLEGAIFVNVDVPNDFAREYREQFRNENQIATACITHDVVRTIGEVLSSSDSSTFFSKLRGPVLRVGKCGSSSFVHADSGEQFFNFPVILKQIESGKIVRLAN